MFAKVVLLAGVLALSGGAAVADQAPQDRASPNSAVRASQPSTPSSSQDSDPQTDLGQRVDDIVVTGQTLEQLADTFVQSASAPPSYRGLARWHSDMCLGVVGLTADAANQIIDRVSEVARGLDVPLGEPGCEPNAVIVATADGQAVAEQLVSERRRAFRIGFTRSNRGSRALETFRTSNDAVRWWHISLPYDFDTGCLAIQVFQGPKACGNSFDRSFRTQNLVDRLRRAIVILDVTKLEGLSFAAVSDLIAFVVLAQIDPEGDVRQFDTVLNLLGGDKGVSGLTTWDHAYLDTLYGAGPLRLNRPAQADALAERLASDSRPATAEEPTKAEN